MIFATSQNDVRIRLTRERWKHIINSHDYLKGMQEEVIETINNPDIILKGSEGELLAAKLYKDKHLVAIYKETSAKDGFVITAFMTSKLSKIKTKRKTIWKKN